jgi:hypothetical protein
VGHGVAVEGGAEGIGQHVRLTHEGRLLGIARVETERLQPEVVLV